MVCELSLSKSIKNMMYKQKALEMNALITSKNEEKSEFGKLQRMSFEAEISYNLVLPATDVAC